MIRDQFLDLSDDTGKFRFYGWRCLVCGDVIDPVILANRREQIRPRISRNRKFIVAVNSF